MLYKKLRECVLEQCLHLTFPKRVKAGKLNSAEGCVL
jgi:hypothetical protein